MITAAMGMMVMSTLNSVTSVMEMIAMVLVVLVRDVIKPKALRGMTRHHVGSDDDYDGLVTAMTV